MKKCSSCTKDLPDAALHCVFCGAKQPPAPAAHPAAMAKTVMGYGANDELNRLRDQAAAQSAGRGAPTGPGQNPAGLGHAATMATPGGLGHAATMASPGPSPGARPGGPQPGGYGAPAGGSFGGAPTAGAQARTMFVDGGPPPGVAGPRPSSPSQPAPMLGPAVPGGMPLGGPSPMADVKTFAPDPGRMAPAVGAPGGPQMPMGGMGGPSMGMGPSMGGPSMGGPSMGGPVGYGAHPGGPSNPDAKTILPAYTPQPVAQAPIGHAPVPAATPPYMAPSYNTNQAARPIDPWKDSLRTQLFIWGGILLACFAVPISLSPLVGMWDGVIHGEGTAKLGPLILVAVGLLSVVIAAMPMATVARGSIAAVLALAGIFVPLFVVGSGGGGGMPEWQSLLSVAGTLLLVPALIARNEYTVSPLPRILITVGALAALAPFVIPRNGSIPLVDLFKLLIEAPGTFKVAIGLIVAYVLVLVLSLLAWMPAPATAGAKVLAWVLVLFPLLMHATGILLSGGEGISFEHALNPTILGWAYGGGLPGRSGPMLGALSLGSAYIAIAGYGLASVIGKKLE